MSNKLSFSIAINLLTKNFKKNANSVKNVFKSMQMQVLTFASALGVGGLGLANLLSRFREVARDTNRVLTALKNVSEGTTGYANNLRFLNELSKKYGLEINALIGNFARFTASATQANMPMDQQKKVFEAVSRAITAFSLSASETDGVMLALSQMMSKGKISSEELRKQMGDKLPVAMQAMAKALGVSIGQMEKMISRGKVMSADVLPKFADALNEIVKDVDTDNLETSIGKLSNAFGNVVDASGFTAKYKALIDSLTSLLESASKNFQKIIVGIVAAIAFVITAGATKIVKRWLATATEMATESKKLEAQLTLATTSRVAAQNRLETARLNHSVATGKARLRATEEVAKAEILYARAVVAEDRARLALTQSNAGRTAGIWTKSINVIKLGAAKLVVTLKSLWASFAPAIIISAFATLTTYIINAYNASKKLENLTKDYNGEVEKERININILFNRLRDATEGTEKYNKAKNEILSKYGNYLEGLSKEVRSLKDVEGAYKAISSAAIQAAKDRAISRGTEEATNDYIKVYKRNASTLKKELESSFGKEKGTRVFERIIDQLGEKGSIDSETQALIDSLTKTMVVSHGTAGLAETVTINNSQLAISEIKGAKGRLDKELEEINSIFGKASTSGNDTTPITHPGSDTPPDDKALRAAEKRLEARRKLDEADKQRQVDKLEFDNKMRQASIDVMLDGFNKEQAQLELNHKIALQEIEEYKNKSANSQKIEAQNKYLADNGTNTGFEKYYADLKANNFKSKEGADILPEGLRPEDISTRIDMMTEAAQQALNKGNLALEKEINKFTTEQYLRYASQLDQQLADIEARYAAELKQAKGSAADIALITENREKDRTAAVLQWGERQLEFEAQYNQKSKELTSAKYVFEADKRRESLKQELADAESRYKNLEKQLENDPKNNDLVNALREARLQIKGINKDLDKTKNEKLSEIAQSAAEIFTSLRNTLGDFGVEFSDEVNKALDGIAQTLNGVASIDVTKPVSIVTGALQSLGGIAKSVMNIFGGTGRERYAKNVEAYQRLMTTIDNVVARQKELLDSLAGTEAKAQSKKSEQLLNKQIQAARELGDEFLNTKRKAGGNRERKYTGNIMKPYRQELSKYGVDVNNPFSILGLDPKTLKRLQEELPKFWASLQPDLSGYLEEIISYGDALDDLKLKEKEQYTGISFDTLNNSLMTLVKQADLAFAEIQESFEDHMSNAILNFVKNNILKDKLKKWYDDFAAAMDDGVLSKDEADTLRAKYEQISRESNEHYKNAMQAAGIKIPNKDSGQSSSKGYSTSMDQDTGGAILGRITGIHESILTLTSMLNGMATNNPQYMTSVTGIGDQLKKHTALFYEMRDIQTKTLTITKDMKDSLSVLDDIRNDINSINKNTKGLAAR